MGNDKQISPDNVGLELDQANALATRHLGTEVPIFAALMRQENLVYDLASVIFGADRFMLREHFRCAAPIMEFSKRQFYNNELSPLRLSKASERFDPVLIDVLIREALEGERDEVQTTFDRIALDPRHDEIDVLSSQFADRPRFKNWSMAFVGDTPALRRRFADAPLAALGRRQSGDALLDFMLEVARSPDDEY